MTESNEITKIKNSDSNEKNCNWMKSKPNLNNGKNISTWRSPIKK